jgi:adenosine kinase
MALTQADAVSIIVTGSIAVDHLSTFPGRFAEQLLPDALDRISLSFLVDSMEVRRGGVAANIAIGMARLGQRPTVVAAAGTDFADYRSWLERSGVDVESIAQSASVPTARFHCLTDQDGNQIASFYTGAMSQARELELRHTVDRLGGVRLVVISPNDPEAMLRHTVECRERGYPFAADPSQQLAVMSRDEIRRLVEGARYLFTNEYEHDLALQKMGWSEREVLRRVDTWVTTLGAKGVRISQLDQPAAELRTVAVDEVVDPTGVGDGFRAGFLAAVSRDLPDLRAVQLGCGIAGLVLQTVGPQDYELRPALLIRRLASAYGRPAAAEIAVALGWAAGG